MRLRRENGDFQIKVIEGTSDTISKNLLAEDFIGQIVINDGSYEVVTNATENESGEIIIAQTDTYTVAYTKSTGEILVVEEFYPSDDLLPDSELYPIG